MKRTKITPNASAFPEELLPILSAGEAYDSSCSPEARVIYIDGDGGYFIKSAPAGALKSEAQMDAYFHRKGLGAEVLLYLQNENRDWLVTRRVSGEDLTHESYLAQPRRLAVMLGERLRALHEERAEDCPVKDRMTPYFSLAETNYLAGVCDPSFFCGFGETDAERIYRIVDDNRQFFKNDTLLHGDYCLPNVLCKDWEFSGFIDLGNGGVGDRHVDLFWGAWTLCFNLGTDRYRSVFFDAYGRDRIEPDALRVIAAAECFG